MTSKKYVDFSTIHKRNVHLASSMVNESVSKDCERLYENLDYYLQNSKDGTESALQRSLSTYLEAMCDRANANKYYRQPIKLIECFNSINESVANKVLNEYINHILPYVSNIEYIKDLSGYKLTDTQKDAITEAVDKYIASDRIVKNHNNLCNRYNIEAEAKKIKYSGLKQFCEDLAYKIDSYNIKPYQKLNLTLEETVYCLGKIGYKFDKAEAVKYITDYFLMKESVNIDDYKRTLEKTAVLEDTDLSQVQFLFTECDNVNTIGKAIELFLASPEKTPESIIKFTNYIKSNFSGIDIAYNLDAIICLFWDMVKAELFETNVILYKCLTGIIKYAVASVMNNEAGEIGRENINQIINTLSGLSDKFKSTANINPYLVDSATEFLNIAIDPAIAQLTAAANRLYDQANLDNMEFVNRESVESIPLNEFKLFKFHNLIRAAFNLNKFSKAKMKNISTGVIAKTKNFIKKTKSLLWGESTNIENNIMSYIGSDNKADICIEQYFIDESDENICSDYLAKVCNEFNSELDIEGMNSIRAYYIINPGIAELHIKESAKVELTEEQSAEVMKHYDPSLDTYIDIYAESVSSYDKIEDINVEEVMDIYKSMDFKEFTYEQFSLALECFKFLNVDESFITSFGNRYDDYRYSDSITNESTYSFNETKMIENAIDKWTRYDNVPEAIQLEAFEYLTNLAELLTENESIVESKDNTDPYGVNKYFDEAVNKPKVGGEAIEDKAKKKGLISKVANADKDLGHKIRKNIGAEDKETGGKGSGIKLNDIKLGLAGLRDGFKKLSGKEKEVSENLDANVRVLVKNMKNAMVSDRREAIIKGSIIPSFSKCIKAGIVLAGIGIINPVAAIIVALGGFAVSKSLTMKERVLLLDEIETELDVVEKEIATAESNGKMKKYRELLKYKKNLQRQYQRIRYNIRVGKDILPNSAAGIPNKD